MMFLMNNGWAQTHEKQNKEIEFEEVDGKTMVKENETGSSMSGADSDDDTGIDEDDMENISYRGASIYFLYLEWMAGYGTYQNFDVMSIHYRHDGNVSADTLVLTGYHHPAPYKVTSNYGKRRKRMHYGIDLGFPLGTPVVAAFDGIVRVSQIHAGGYGNLVVIRHDNGLETYYGHLSKRMVNPGQVVRAGDTIGLGGNTGRSYGCHLHFETRYLGIPFNPRQIIDFDSMQLTCDTLFVKGNEQKNLIVDNKKTRNAPDLTPSQPIASSRNTTTYYKVKSGDTLSGIAFRYGTSVTTIKKINGLRNDFLSVGQQLRIK